MKYHGLYCGPNWSAGKRQLSVATGPEAVDELDSLCKLHDAAYATSTDPRLLQRADKEFAIAAIKLGWPKSVVAGIAVGGQALYRAIDNSIFHNNNNNNMVSKAMQAHQNFTRRAIAYEKAAIAATNLPKMVPAKPTIPKGKQSTMKQYPAAYSITSTNGKPMTKSSKDGGVILSHRGLISGFSGSTTFVAQNFQVNPGLGSVFPWASQLARSYDKYRFRKLKFEYRSVVPTTTAGVVMMSFDFDTLDTLPASKFEHSQTTPNTESNSFNSFELSVDCDNTWRFVRQGGISGTDLKTYDFGQLVISSSYGVSALIGEIYVSYEVELAKPSHGVPICAKIQSVATSVAFPFQSDAIFTGSAQPVVYNGLGAFKFTRPGEYHMTQKLIGTNIVSTPLPVAVGTISAGGAVAAVDAAVVNSTGTIMTSTWKFRAGAGDVYSIGAPTADSITNCKIVFNETEYATL